MDARLRRLDRAGGAGDDQPRGAAPLARRAAAERCRICCGPAATGWSTRVLTPPIFAVARRWPIARPHIARRALLHLGFSLLFCVGVGGRRQDPAARAAAASSARTKSASSQAGRRSVLADGSAGSPELDLHHAAVRRRRLPVASPGSPTRSATSSKPSEREVQMARLSEQLAGARLAALQAQLNPHFLFNSLNTIAVLVRDGDTAGGDARRSSSSATCCAARSSRTAPTKSRSRTSWSWCGSTWRSSRRGSPIGSARCSRSIRRRSRAAVPSFALQHLVENAVRHGIAQAHRRRPGRRSRRAATATCSSCRSTTTAPGMRRTGGATGEGHGLDNTRERLRTLYGDRASLDRRARRPGGGTIARAARALSRDRSWRPSDDADALSGACSSPTTSRRRGGACASCSPRFPTSPSSANAATGARCWRRSTR